MSEIHLFIGQKGGTGKTFFASVFAQYLAARNRVTVCVDADPLNRSLASFAALNASTINIENVSERVEDVVERVVTASTNETILVVDTPSEFFTPFLTSVSAMGPESFFKGSGRKLTLHTVITGGLPADATLRGLKLLSEAFPKTPLAVWCNPFFGNIKYEGTDPQHPERIQTIEQLLVAHGHIAENQLCGLVKVPYFRDRDGGNSYDANIVRMLGQRLTFTEAMLDEERFNLFQRARLKYVRDIFFQVIHLGLFAAEPLPDLLLQKIPAPEEQNLGGAN